MEKRSNLAPGALLRGLVTILFSSSKARRCEIKKPCARRPVVAHLVAHTQSLGCNFLPFRIVKERPVSPPAGEPFQARALTPSACCKSFERLQLLVGKEYHRPHHFIRQSVAVNFSSPATRP